MFQNFNDAFISESINLVFVDGVWLDPEAVTVGKGKKVEFLDLPKKAREKVRSNLIFSKTGAFKGVRSPHVKTSIGVVHCLTEANGVSLWLQG